MEIPVDLWLWPLDVDDARFHALSRHLSEDEASRAAAFVYERDRRRFVVGRGRLREILAITTGQSPGDVQFQYDALGKPGLASGPPFNLSHSAGWAALAISPGPAVGVDIEALRPIDRAVAERFFSPQEVAALSRLGTQEWPGGFFRCWTRKEAFLKACGTGLWQRLDSFDVTLGPDEEARVTRIDDGAGVDVGPPEAWALAHLELGHGFAGAIALRTSGTIRVNYRDWKPPLCHDS